MIIKSCATVNRPNIRNDISYKDIGVTNHAMQRASERMKITSKQEIKKMAVSAKKNGVCISAMNEVLNDTKAQFGKESLNYKNAINKYSTLFNMTPQLIEEICDNVNIKTNSARVYLYKGYFFVFAGTKGRTLVTIYEMYEQLNKGEII